MFDEPQAVIDVLLGRSCKGRSNCLLEKCLTIGHGCKGEQRDGDNDYKYRAG